MPPLIVQPLQRRVFVILGVYFLFQTWPALRNVVLLPRLRQFDDTVSSNLRYEEFDVRYVSERQVWRASGERKINGLRECCCDIGVHILGGMRLLPACMRVSREHPLNGR